MTKIRWGVLSTANIGVKHVIPAMQTGEHCEMVGIASRNLDRARMVATELGMPRAYRSYEELLADEEIEAVYIPLPNHLHVPWSIKALEAGKHVLCEKPIALNAAGAQELLDAAREWPGLKVMEAFMYRHHPQWQRARRLVAEGQIGALRTIQSFFSYYGFDPENIRNVAEFGGGVLMDIGCYSISLSRFIFDAEPQRVWGVMEYDSRFEVDRLTSGVLDFGSGTSTFTCSTQLVPYQRANLFGTEGRVEIEIPFNAPPDRPCKMWHRRGDEIEEIVLEVCNQYTIQGDLFSRAVLEDTEVPTPLQDAVANMKVIDALVRSAGDGTWASV
jgi:predicted dehydrogenase